MLVGSTSLALAGRAPVPVAVVPTTGTGRTRLGAGRRGHRPGATRKAGCSTSPSGAPRGSGSPWSRCTAGRPQGPGLWTDSPLDEWEREAHEEFEKSLVPVARPRSPGVDLRAVIVLAPPGHRGPERGREGCPARRARPARVEPVHRLRLRLGHARGAALRGRPRAGRPDRGELTRRDASAGQRHRPLDPRAVRLLGKHLHAAHRARRPGDGRCAARSRGDPPAAPCRCRRPAAPAGRSRRRPRPSRPRPRRGGRRWTAPRAAPRAAGRRAPPARRCRAAPSCAPAARSPAPGRTP